jgi:hypothetical protein
MTKYRSGETVKAGFYWNRATWAAEVVPAGGGTLAGEPGAKYDRIAWPVLLVLAPLMGGAFAMFLPFIGVAMLVKVVAGKVTDRSGSRRAAART